MASSPQQQVYGKRLYRLTFLINLKCGVILAWEYPSRILYPKGEQHIAQILASLNLLR